VRPEVFGLLSTATGRECSSLYSCIPSLTAQYRQAKVLKLLTSSTWNNHELLAVAVQDVRKLDRLVQHADVVFMLTDSRESRWLPSLLAAAHDTLMVNAALGFDSWVVMRHGGAPAAAADARDAPSAEDTRLGCYFCNDVVAPANSAGGRSMDEQCTVVRPGLARIAAAHAVEMAAALSQHDAWLRAPPLDTDAAAPVMDAAGAGQQGPALGGVPHMLRGCLTGFSQTHMTGRANGCCSACSKGVVDGYRTGGVDFVLRAIQASSLAPCPDQQPCVLGFAHHAVPLHCDAHLCLVIIAACTVALLSVDPDDIPTLHGPTRSGLEQDLVTRCRRTPTWKP
jgi:ThiF family